MSATDVLTVLPLKLYFGLLGRMRRSFLWMSSIVSEWTMADGLLVTNVLTRIKIYYQDALRRLLNSIYNSGLRDFIVSGSEWRCQKWCFEPFWHKWWIRSVLFIITFCVLLSKREGDHDKTVIPAFYFLSPSELSHFSDSLFRFQTFIYKLSGYHKLSFLQTLLLLIV